MRLEDSISIADHLKEKSQLFDDWQRPPVVEPTVSSLSVTRSSHRTPCPVFFTSALCSRIILPRASWRCTEISSSTYKTQIRNTGRLDYHIRYSVDTMFSFAFADNRLPTNLRKLVSAISVIELASQINHFIVQHFERFHLDIYIAHVKHLHTFSVSQDMRTCLSYLCVGNHRPGHPPTDHSPTWHVEQAQWHNDRISFALGWSTVYTLVSAAAGKPRLEDSWYHEHEGSKVCVFLFRIWEQTTSG